MGIPAPIEPSAPDIAGLSESLFHEISSVCDTPDQAIDVVWAVLYRIDAHYMERAGS